MAEQLHAVTDHDAAAFCATPLYERISEGHMAVPQMSHPAFCRCSHRRFAAY